MLGSSWETDYYRSFLSKYFDNENLLKISVCGNIKIEKAGDALAGDDNCGTANRYGPDNRTGSKQGTI